MASSHELSYTLHTQAETIEATANKFPSAITEPTSIDNLRHTRMLDAIATPIAHAYRGSTWLTVGDGHFGSDAIRLGAHGIDVHASSLTDATLRVSHDRGWISAYSAQNAESLTFPDDSFDFVLCKEAYHHFPRPPVAFYEMLRVARTAVILIEPNERATTPLGFLRAFAKKLTGRFVMDDYEPSGNYIYRIRLAEITKMARSLNLPAIAHQYFNDFYHPGFFCKAAATNAEYALFAAGVKFQNLLSSARLMPAGGIACAVFKEKPQKATVARLRKKGVHFSALPRNPYAMTEEVP